MPYILGSSVPEAASTATALVALVTALRNLTAEVLSGGKKLAREEEAGYPHVTLCCRSTKRTFGRSVRPPGRATLRRGKAKWKGTLNTRWFLPSPKLTDSVECSPRLDEGRGRREKKKTTKR